MEFFDTARKLHKALQKQAPDYFVGDFIYGWANNYAGTNLCNLDVTLATLQRFAPEAKVIVFTDPRSTKRTSASWRRCFPFMPC